MYKRNFIKISAAVEEFKYKHCDRRILYIIERGIFYINTTERIQMKFDKPIVDPWD